MNPTIFAATGVVDPAVIKGILQHEATQYQTFQQITSTRNQVMRGPQKPRLHKWQDDLEMEQIYEQIRYTNLADIFQHRQQYIQNTHKVEILGLQKLLDQKHVMIDVMGQYKEVIIHIITQDIQEVHSVQ